jgi:hypothetical protein
MVVQYYVTSAETVRVTPATRFFGVANFDDMVATYRAGYQLSVTVTTDDIYAEEISAVDVFVQKSGPFAVHFHQPASLDRWAGLPALHGIGKTTVLILPWTVVRADSEIQTIDDILQALTAYEGVCVAGEGFTAGVATTQASTIGAWHYTGDSFNFCSDK